MPNDSPIAHADETVTIARHATFFDHGSLLAVLRLARITVTTPRREEEGEHAGRIIPPPYPERALLEFEFGEAEVRRFEEELRPPNLRGQRAALADWLETSAYFTEDYDPAGDGDSARAGENPRAELCWASKPDFSPCNKPAETDVGLCRAHHEKLGGD